MRTHGSISSFTVLREQQQRAMSRLGTYAALPPELQLQTFPGFTHFIKDPGGPNDVFKLNGEPFVPSSSWWRAEDLMRRLAHRICCEPPLEGDENGIDRRFNPCLPSGYTYFLQLIAHDLINSSIFLSRSKGQMSGLANTRELPLRLETIYGGGPTQCPHAYHKNGGSFRNQLRLGWTRMHETACPMVLRDIARGTTGTQSDLGRVGYTDALVADQRNDSHAIISQLITLFYQLHNAIIEKLETDNAIPSTGNDFADSQRVFVAAQAACVLIYRHLIRCDLLGKLLHPEVHKFYDKNEDAVLHKPFKQEGMDWQVPVEFTHGFFRVGHAMIRPNYVFNPGQFFTIGEILEQSSEKHPTEMPFERKWIADWSLFFRPKARSDNFSHRIVPRAHAHLENAIQEDGINLITRDLMSSIAVQPWSLGGLIGLLPAAHRDLLQHSPFLKDFGTANPAPWASAITAWLEKDCPTNPANRLTKTEIGHLAAHPPIPFFARFEAGEDPAIAGKHLGVLTSIVVADVLYGILRQDRIFGIRSCGDLKAQMRELSAAMLQQETSHDASIFAPFDEIVSFDALLTFLGPQAAYPTDA